MLMRTFLTPSALFVKVLIVSCIFALTSCTDTTLEEMKQDNMLQAPPASFIQAPSTTTPSSMRVGENANGLIQIEIGSVDNDYRLRGNPPKPSFRTDSLK